MLDRAWLTNAGPLVRELEEEIASVCEVDHCVTVANGTLALQIATRALGMSGEVIMPAFTFVATAHALLWQGAAPIFADIDPRTHQIDPRAVQGLITDDTTGIVGVHLWGHPAPIAELTALAADAGVPLVFDAAHAFGTRVDNRPIGAFGDAEVFSFHATKVFNTLEGGAVLTNNADLAERTRLMRNFGFVDYDKVIYPGTNGKLNEASAAVGLANLVDLPRFLDCNLRNHAAYSDALHGSTVARIMSPPTNVAANHHYVVVELAEDLVSHRDALVEYLHDAGVLARRYFWPGCHRMAPYASHPIDLPVTDEVASRIIVLPTGSAIAPEACRTVMGLLVDEAHRIRRHAGHAVSAR